jgi:hypothetical protein
MLYNCRVRSTSRHRTEGHRLLIGLSRQQEIENRDRLPLRFRGDRSDNLVSVVEIDTFERTSIR